MPAEFFQVLRPKAVLGIRRADLDPILTADGVFGQIGAFLETSTENEPLHVGLRDLGYTAPTATPLMIGMEVVEFQVDGGLNEIPRATCRMAVGRDMFRKIAGATDRVAMSIVHVLERYLNQHIPARLYVNNPTTSSAGTDGSAVDGGNDEWVVMFDGFLSAPNRRSDAQTAEIVFHLSHFTAALTFSSCLSSNTAPGSSLPAEKMISTFPLMTAGLGLPVTVYGATTATMTSTCYSDFWGYQVPAGLPISQNAPPLLPLDGVKGFLTRLALSNQFAWSTLSRTDLNARACASPTGDQLRNNAALYALNRIEPLWPDWDALAGAVVGIGVGANAGRDLALSTWADLKSAVDTVLTVRNLADSTLAVDRSNMRDLAPAAYKRAGFIYGMPIKLQIDDRALGPPVGRGFASDIARATFSSLNPFTFWDLISTQYPSRYQIAIAPMADRAVVLPAQPLLDGVWQRIYASEIYDYADDMQTPIPIRGVILTSDRASLTGAFPGGYQPIEAAYDSCQPGRFEQGTLPDWLASSTRAPGAFSNNAGLPRMGASTPGALAAVVGVGFEAAVNVPTYHQSLANRIAQALFQRERLRYRSVSVVGRFRYDIGPGSIVQVDVPSDKYVRQSLDGARNSRMVGMVLRVTMSLNAEQKSASTSYQLGFVRTDGETKTGQPLYANRHPFWATAVYGVPWADASWIRTRLGDKAALY